MNQVPFSVEPLPDDEFSKLLLSYVADSATAWSDLEEAACRAAAFGGMGVRIENYFDGTAIFITPDVPAREVETWQMHPRSIRERRTQSPHPPAP